MVVQQRGRRDTRARMLNWRRGQGGINYGRVPLVD
jgi:hypothetical protein